VDREVSCAHTLKYDLRKIAGQSLKLTLLPFCKLAGVLYIEGGTVGPRSQKGESNDVEVGRA
jgi:hypothetical protein